MLRKSKFLRTSQIIVFALFAIGCERETQNAVPTQTDAITPEYSVANETMPEEFAQEVVPGETEVSLTLIKTSPSANRTVYVDRYVTGLTFASTPLIGIEGLEQLEFLETIVFDRLTNLNDASFLAQVPQLKNLFFSDTAGWEMEWSFIEQLPNLEVLHVDGSRSSNISIDLRNNRRLEFIGFMFSRLETFPVLLNVPDTLIYLSLEGNRIVALPDDFDTIPSTTTVILSFNPFEITEATPSNVTTEDFVILVTEERFREPEYISAVILGAWLP